MTASDIKKAYQVMHEAGTTPNSIEGIEFDVFEETFLGFLKDYPKVMRVIQEMPSEGAAAFGFVWGTVVGKQRAEEATCAKVVT